MSILLDDPDLQLGGLSIWAISREFAAANDYWDGNWINIRANLVAPGSWVELNGPFLRSDEIKIFIGQLEVMDRDMKGQAELTSMEDVLNAKLRMEKLGEIELTINMTPDHLTQSHRVQFFLDQSYLLGMISGCRQILSKFPVKDIHED